MARVVPHRGTWIEVSTDKFESILPNTSFLIEERGLKLCIKKAPSRVLLSFLIEERGLKYHWHVHAMDAYEVVPHRGTWIEVAFCANAGTLFTVVPHRGTWIEIHKNI